MVTNLIESRLTRLPGGRRILLGLARMSERALPDELLTNEQRLMVAIDALTTRWTVPETADRPVFLLSAG